MELQHCIACSGVMVLAPQSNAYVARPTTSNARNIVLTNCMFVYVSCPGYSSQAQGHSKALMICITRTSGVDKSTRRTPSHSSCTVARSHSSPTTSVQETARAQTTAVCTTCASLSTNLWNSRAKSRTTAATSHQNEQHNSIKDCIAVAVHDASQVVCASVTTVPSFLNQNRLMSGVIRRQDIDKRGLTIGAEIAMVSNRTAITLQCALGQPSAEPDRPTEAHFAESS
jgi:hypothetical protein